MSAAELYLHSEDFSRYFYSSFFRHILIISSRTPLLCLQPFGYFDDTLYEFLFCPMPSEYTAILLSLDIIALIIGCLATNSNYCQLQILSEHPVLKYLQDLLVHSVKNKFLDHAK